MKNERNAMLHVKAVGICGQNAQIDSFNINFYFLQYCTVYVCFYYVDM